MDFNDTPEEAAYRAKARAWLADNAPKYEIRRVGSPMAEQAVDLEDMARAKAWQAKKAEAGYAQITWPKEWGGPGGTPIQSVIFSQEEGRYNLTTAYFIIGLSMCLPVVMTVGDEETRTRFGGPALRGDDIWCQLFSEPSGGSDVAAVRTRAVRDGDDWVINGQKVWTSGAHYSDYGFIITRTDPDVPKHKGLTMFWIDMKAPGVECHPIHQMSGGAHFNQVYLTDVRISDKQRLGDVNDGWRVSMMTLMYERLAASGVGRTQGFDDVVNLAREIQTADGPMLRNASFRERLADWHVQAEGMKHTLSRTLTALSRGDTPGPESSIGKLVLANLSQDLANYAMEMQDEFGIVSDPALAPLQAAFQNALLGSPGGRIAGGTDEIMRNIIAERVLGLPGDVRVDKNLPFKDIPQGA